MSAPPAPSQPTQRRAPFTLAGCLEGIGLSLPMLPGIAVFGCAYGAAASGKGLSFAEALWTSATVYAGLSQMVALEHWSTSWTLGALVSLAVVTAAINGRMVLQAASLQPWLASRSAAFNLVHLGVLTDVNWLIAERYHARGGRDLGVLIGPGVFLWFLWVGMMIPGYMLGQVLGETRRFAFDLLMPLYFLAFLAPLWRGKASLWPWLASAVVALGLSRLGAGYVYVVAGAIAGAATAAFLPDE